MKRLLFAALLTCTLAPVAQAIPSEYDVVDFGITAYEINGVNNPTLTLIRGQTYVFHVNALGHPFYIKTNISIGTGNAFNTGVTGNGTQVGNLTFVVPQSAPNTLFYNCSSHSPMHGTINIVNRGLPGLDPMGAWVLALMVLGFGAVVIHQARLSPKRA